MKLYSYWRSTASYRVRIGLNLKGVAAELIPVHLVRNGGEHRYPGYAAINPGRTVPTLVLEDGAAITQSMAILSYLDETHPEPQLLPANPVVRARVRAAAEQIACDIHPINNLRVINTLKSEFGADQDKIVTWMNHWMALGFDAFQNLIDPDSRFCFAGQLTLADICLVAQFYNARRWGLDLMPFERLVEIEERCLDLPAFWHAHPDNQGDAELV